MKIFTVILTAVSLNGAAQTFEKAIGGPGEETCSRLFVNNGHFISAGHTTSSGSGSYDILLAINDSAGNTISTTVTGSFGEDIALGGAVGHSGEILLTGYTNSFGADQPFAVMYDAAGNVLWEKYYPSGGWGYDAAFLPDGSFYLTGYCGGADVNVMLLKCDPGGNVQWARSFGDSLINEGRRVAVLPDGGAAITGITHVQAGGPTDMLVIRVDSSGRKIWSNRYATGNYLNWDMGYALDVAGEHILTGAVSYSQAFNNNPNSPDALISVLAADGTVRKSFAIGESDYDDIRDIAFLPGGKFCMTGASNFLSQGQTDVLLAIGDTTGTFLYGQLTGGQSYETGLSVVPMSSGRFAIGGYTESYGGGMNDMYIISADTLLPSCNSISASLRTASVPLTHSPALDTIAFSCTAVNASFNTIHPNVPEVIVCGTSGMDDNNHHEELSVFPNPASGTIHINIKDTQAVYGRITDGTGRTVMVFGKEPEVDVTSLMGGMYYLSVYTDGYRGTIKFVKE